MMNTLDPIEHLIDQLTRLPSIGKKSAQRLAYHLLSKDKEVAESLAQAVLDAKLKIKACAICHNYTQAERCKVCSNPGRNERLICVVEKPSDILLFERSGAFQGMYHVLGGCISPLDGIGPDELNIQSLLKRARGLDSPELIMALNTSADGEATVMYLSRCLKDQPVKISRLARGIPMGSDLQYVDEYTMKKSLESRVPL